MYKINISLRKSVTTNTFEIKLKYLNIYVKKEKKNTLLNVIGKSNVLCFDVPVL